MILGKTVNTRVQIKINNVEIETVRTYKYLGIQIDEKFKFDENVDYICRKMAKKIGVLTRTRKNLDFNFYISY